MATENGTVHASETAIERAMTEGPYTIGYRPSLPIANFWTQDGGAAFRVLGDVEAMLTHAAVTLPLQNYKGAISNAEFEVQASNQEAADFGLDMLERFWSRCLAKVQNSYHY